MISGLFQGYPNAIGELWGGTWESERAGIGQNERYGHWGNFNYQSSNLLLYEFKAVKYKLLLNLAV